MNSSGNSSSNPPTTSSERSSQVLLQQCAALCASLPESCAAASAALIEQLRTISSSEIAAEQATAKRIDDLLAQIAALKSIVESFVATAAKLSADWQEEQRQRELDRADRKRLEEKVDRLNSQLAALNDYVPR